MYLQDVGLAGMDWNDLAHDRDSWREIVKIVMKFWVPFLD
jgi:hypothetical protein